MSEQHESAAVVARNPEASQPAEAPVAPQRGKLSAHTLHAETLLWLREMLASPSSVAARWIRSLLAAGNTRLTEHRPRVGPAEALVAVQLAERIGAQLGREVPVESVVREPNCARARCSGRRGRRRVGAGRVSDGCSMSNCVGSGARA